MPSYTTADIRNVLVAGHGASGKTALIDALLFASKTVTRRGNTADGSSFSDFEKEEKDHKHSIYSTILHADHDGKRINLIDTPGSPDLLGAALACLPAVETVAVVINAQNGIGYLMNDARDFMRIDIMVVGLLIYALLGLAVDILVRWLERRFLGWRPSFVNAAA